MRLYDIDSALVYLGDVASMAGELPTEEMYENSTYPIAEFLDSEGRIDGSLVAEVVNMLYSDRETKIENVAHFVVTLGEDIDLLDAEIKRLQARKKATQRKEDWLRSYLQAALGGEKYKSQTSPLQITYRKSRAVEIEDEAKIPAEFMRVKTVTEPNKTAIKAAIDGGAIVAGAKVVERQSMIIK